MTKLIIRQDELDNDFCQVYHKEGSRPITWIFGIYVEDVERIFGKDTFDNLYNTDHSSAEVELEIQTRFLKQN